MTIGLWVAAALMLGLLLGAFLAWAVLSSREARNSEQLRLSQARLSEEARLLKARLMELQTENATRESALVAANFEKAALGAKLETLEINDERWQAQFEAFMLKTVGQSREAFEEYLAKAGKEKEEKFEQRLDETLKPLTEIVEKFGKQNIEIADRIQMLSQTNSRVVSALSYNKGRGDWGEMELIRLLEESGLTEGVGYVKQKTLPGEEAMAKKRPDVRVNLPDGRVIFIDAKAIQVDLSDFPDGDTPDAHQARRERYAKSLKEAVKNLSGKEYQAGITDSADFVVLYVPREGMLAYALEADPNLFAWAYGLRVVLAGPLNIMAMLSVVHHSWAMARLSEDASKILALGTKLQKQAVVFAEKFGVLGKNLAGALKSYQETKTSFDGQQGFTRQIKKLETYGCVAAKPMTEPADMADLAPDVLMLEL